MKTVLIFDQLGLAPIKFCVLDGDYSHLDEAYFSGYLDHGERGAELFSLIYDSSGNEKVKFLEKFPTDVVREGDVSVIVAGVAL